MNTHERHMKEEQLTFEDTTCILTMSEDRILPKSQLEDYKYRGDAFDDMDFIHFIKDTYEQRVSSMHSHSSTHEDDEDDDNSRRPASGGRPTIQTKDGYRQGHPSQGKVIRVLRQRGHKMLLDIVGGYFPRDDNPETYTHYCACMLAALKPWRNLHELKPEGQSWQEAYDQFRSEARPETIRILSNMQYYYECRDAAVAKAKEYHRDGAAGKESGKERGSDDRNVDDAFDYDEDRA
jgi:hypothetical protein